MGWLGDDRNFDIWRPFHNFGAWSGPEAAGKSTIGATASCGATGSLRNQGQDSIGELSGALNYDGTIEVGGNIMKWLCFKWPKCWYCAMLLCRHLNSRGGPIPPILCMIALLHGQPIFLWVIDSAKIWCAALKTPRHHSFLCFLNLSKEV